jgi:hypothetical protein
MSDEPIRPKVMLVPDPRIDQVLSDPDAYMAKAWETRQRQSRAWIEAALERVELQHREQSTLRKLLHRLGLSRTHHEEDKTQAA